MFPHANQQLRQNRGSSASEFIEYLCLSSAKRCGQSKYERSRPDFILHCKELYIQQNGRCALSGVPMTHGTEPRHPCQISIDRINTAVGYVAGNVRLVAWYMANAHAGLGDDIILFFARATVHFQDNKRRNANVK